MINLLPPIAKRHLLKEYRLRLGVVSLWAIFILEVFAFALYLPSYYVLSLSTNALTHELEQKKLLPPTANDEIPQQLASIKKELLLLKPIEGVDDAQPSRVIRELLANKPRGVEIIAVAYATAKGGAAVQLSGIADTREALAAFNKLLWKIPRVGKVKFGSSFIAKKTAIDFTVTVDLK